jgi:hypothetical protein
VTIEFEHGVPVKLNGKPKSAQPVSAALASSRWTQERSDSSASSSARVLDGIRWRRSKGAGSTPKLRIRAA